MNPARETPLVIDVTASWDGARLWLDGCCIAELPGLTEAWKARGAALRAAHDSLGMLAATLAMRPREQA